MKVCDCETPVPGTTVNNYGYQCMNCSGWISYLVAFKFHKSKKEKDKTKKEEQ